jgi:hypothetical protein
MFVPNCCLFRSTAFFFWAHAVASSPQSHRTRDRLNEFTFGEIDARLSDLQSLTYRECGYLKSQQHDVEHEELTSWRVSSTPRSVSHRLRSHGVCLFVKLALNGRNRECPTGFAPRVLLQFLLFLPQHQSEVEFPFKQTKSIDGMIWYLTRKHGGNVRDKVIVVITSKSVYDNPDVAVWNLDDLAFGSMDSETVSPKWCSEFVISLTNSTHDKDCIVALVFNNELHVPTSRW